MKHEKLHLQPYLQSQTENLIVYKSGKMLKILWNPGTSPGLRTQSDNSLAPGTPSYIDLLGANPSTIGNILKFKFNLLHSVTPGAPISAATV